MNIEEKASSQIKYCRFKKR